MRVKKSAWLMGVAFFSITCSSSPTATVNIRIATNGTVNPLQQIKQQKDAGLSRGIYFEFRELKCPPVSMEDVVSTTAVALYYPDLNAQANIDGTSPVSSTYEIDTSALKPNAYYRVAMFALNVFDNNKPFQGVAECPLNLALGNRNLINICFGDTGIPLTCLGTVPALAQCPSMTPASCAP
ncbi:MAG: hypothetical protein V1495_08105 [Pseudomonadota bacterium]